MPDRNPTGGKSQNTGVLGHFGLGRPLAPREILGPGRKQKTQFPGAGGPEIEGRNYHAIRDGCPQLFCTSRFGRPDPQGREIAKHGYFRPFWPRTAFGTWRNPGRRLKTEKRSVPALAVPKSKKKSHHAIKDGCPQLFHALRFARPDPHEREIAKYGYFRPFWPRTALGT